MKCKLKKLVLVTVNKIVIVTFLCNPIYGVNQHGLWESQGISASSDPTYSRLLYAGEAPGNNSSRTRLRPEELKQMSDK